MGISRDCPNFLSTPIISGTGKATNLKFCTHILRIDRNKSPLQISGKVARCVVRTLETFQGTHLLGASRGHLCDSSAVLLFVAVQIEVVHRRDTEVMKAKKDAELAATQFEANEVTLKKRFQEQLADVNDQLERANKAKSKYVSLGQLSLSFLRDRRGCVQLFRVEDNTV